MKLRTAILLVAILAVLTTMPQVTKDTSEARISSIGPCFSLLTTYIQIRAAYNLAYYEAEQYHLWFYGPNPTMEERQDARINAWIDTTELRSYMNFAMANYERDCGAITQ